ncbi:SDR family NAD(P)-dependent oxidoreductase [Microvirga terrestris]|uniref:SDR family oxidoreductase n=1 Tax=Microvirga terrestris TaxID=2791024 RepID=A0ABS0HSX3_9HYPH|nr:SDR family NAD(P)-dependent oxidoreductase [Microvirga terrestris]MBF9196322.1 SDR family oxidoreductase [Microvirga terrestris]
MAQEYLSSLFSVAGKTALVTGGATGIGRMIAEALVRAGARVLIASRKGEACEAVARELNALDSGGTAEGFAGNVGTQDGVMILASEVKARTPHLHILVNNAGKTWGESLEQFPHKAWESVFSVNVAGLFTLTQQLLPLLEAAASDDDPARIVNLGSVMGAAPIGDNAYSYAASKAAVHHLTRILAKEFALRRITVNAFAPGPFQSRMTAFVTGDEQKRALVAASVPFGRIGRPDDIAGALLFLCGRGGAYTTGAIIPLDGGISVETGHKIFGEAAL